VGHEQPDLDGQPTIECEVFMAPAHSLARLRKHVLGRVARGEVSMTQAARRLGFSRSRLAPAASGSPG
jgi:predicted GNAT superfamily acetyltransferase